mmetsp:Transcript_24193/g.53856  ORF Transcript_24193/g.53856 Transcript_24193/m.53856 type:complete len:250 (+) Transcript_24193:164-913(+)
MDTRTRLWMEYRALGRRPVHDQQQERQTQESFGWRQEQGTHQWKERSSRPVEGAVGMGLGGKRRRRCGHKRNQNRRADPTRRDETKRRRGRFVLHRGPPERVFRTPKRTSPPPPPRISGVVPLFDDPPRHCRERWWCRERNGKGGRGAVFPSIRPPVEGLVGETTGVSAGTKRPDPSARIDPPALFVRVPAARRRRRRRSRGRGILVCQRHNKFRLLLRQRQDQRPVAQRLGERDCLARHGLRQLAAQQ